MVDTTFEIGGKYRNRIGEYEVIKIEGSRITIQYSEGDTYDVDAKGLHRIWQNIQDEMKQPSCPPRPPVEPRGGQTRATPSGGQRGLAFQGLNEHDFKRGTAGTSWRSRANLGGLLAQRVSDRTGRFFQSYAIYRRAEVHIVQPACYILETGEREAKFVIHLDEYNARYGFYIEKGNDPMDETWHWLHFIRALDRNKKLQGELKTAMAKHNLHWEIYAEADGGLTAEVTVTQNGLVWHRQGTDGISWDGFVDRLRGIGAHQWCNLYLSALIPKDKAIDMGTRIADPVTEVYQALLPLYEASVVGSGKP